MKHDARLAHSGKDFPAWNIFSSGRSPVKHDARLARLERRRTLADQDDTLSVRIVDYDGSVIASYQLPAHTGAIDYRKHLGLLDETRQLTFTDD